MSGRALERGQAPVSLPEAWFVLKRQLAGAMARGDPRSPEPQRSPRSGVKAQDSLVQELEMATTKKQTARGRTQGRARVAGGQEHEVRYEVTKTGKPKAAVKAAVKAEGNSRKKVE